MVESDTNTEDGATTVRTGAEWLREIQGSGDVQVALVPDEDRIDNELPPEVEADAEALVGRLEREVNELADESDRYEIVGPDGMEADTVQSGSVALEDEELRTRYENAVSEEFEFYQVNDEVWEITTESGSTYTLIPSDGYSGSPDARYRDVAVDKCLIALALHSPDAREQLRFALLESNDSVVDSDSVDELNEIVARIAELERQAEKLVDEMDEERAPVVQLFNMLQGSDE